MKKAMILLIVVLGSFSMLSCQLEFDFDALYGSNWEFSNDSLYFFSSEYMEPNAMDFHLVFQSGEDYYSCIGNGVIDGDKIMGSYDCNIVEDEAGPIATDQNITVIIRMSNNDKLTVYCVGEGPLDGKHFINGERKISHR